MEIILVPTKNKDIMTVYLEQKIVGTVKRFCCGWDFRPKGKPNVMFSIPVPIINLHQLTICLDKLTSIPIPNTNLHWNFSYETATNECKFDAFKNSLKSFARKQKAKTA